MVQARQVMLQALQRVAEEQEEPSLQAGLGLSNLWQEALVAAHASGLPQDWQNAVAGGAGGGEAGWEQSGRAGGPRAGRGGARGSGGPSIMQRPDSATGAWGGARQPPPQAASQVVMAGSDCMWLASCLHERQSASLVA